MLISIILPTVRATTVSYAIDAILTQTDEEWELIVVPQGDDISMMEMLDEYVARDARIRYVHTPTMGLSHARNVGTEAALGDVLAFTDDDCEVAPDWIAVLRDLFTANPEVGVVGGEVVAAPNPRPWRISTCPAAHAIDAKYSPLDDGWTTPPGFYAIGANISIRTELAHRVGPWDDVFGAGVRFGACEDQDFLLRAEALGAVSMVSTRLIVHHTYGRRDGLRTFIRHQRAYARGRGAWVAKLTLWGHPVVARWEQKPSAPKQIAFAVTRPHKWLLAKLGAHYAKQAREEYFRGYLLGEDVLSHPRPTPSHPVAVGV